MKKKYIVSVIVSTLFLVSSVWGESLEQRADEIFMWFQAEINQRISSIPLPSLRDKHEKRLWSRYSLLLNRQIRLWSASDRVLYQAVQTKIVERNNDYLTQSTSDLTKQRELINAVNNYRKMNDLTTLNYNSELTKAAYQHALDLSNNFPYDADGDGSKELISHIGTDGSRVVQRAEYAWYSYSFLAENIAYNQITAVQVLQDWINSPTHYDNLVSSKPQDIAVVKVWPYWVMVMWTENN